MKSPSIRSGQRENEFNKDLDESFPIHIMASVRCTINSTKKLSVHIHANILALYNQSTKEDIHSFSMMGSTKTITNSRCC